MQQWDDEGDQQLCGMMLDDENDYGNCIMEGGATPPLMDEKR